MQFRERNRREARPMNATMTDRLRLSMPAGRVIRVCSGVACLLALAALSSSRLHAEEPAAERITFRSADGQTTLVGYLFKPTTPVTARVPAVVMMHGRAGAYSERAK